MPSESREGDHGGSEEIPTGPPIPEDITGRELDKVVQDQLRTMSRAASTRVARHLVAAGRLLDEDPDKALEHAEAARQDGGRLAVVREACGVAAYMAGRYEKALAEFRAARRISGEASYLPMMADSERGLGRPERALELASGDEARRLPVSERMELRIVEAGARRDLGQPQAAAQLLAPFVEKEAEWSVRVRYAYADTLEELGRTDEAAEWFERAAAADPDEETDAAERASDLRSSES